jgi:hypothetical protein
MNLDEGCYSILLDTCIIHHSNLRIISVNIRPQICTYYEFFFLPTKEKVP